MNARFSLLQLRHRALELACGLGVLLLGFVSPAVAQETEADSFAPIITGPSAGWYGRGEYVFWWLEGNRVPALVSTSPNGTPQNQAGVLGTAGARPLFGGQGIQDEVRSGFNLALGGWLDDEQTLGAEVDFYFVGNESQTGDYQAQSPGLPILARPFFNAGLNAEDSELVAYPNILSGSISIQSSSELYSGAALIRQRLATGSDRWIDALYGYRHLEFSESLDIREDLTSTNPGGLVPLNTRFLVSDSFATVNDFHGGELGLQGEVLRGMFSVELLTRVALGNMHRRAVISGQTTTTVPAQPANTTAGGLLALPTNIGVLESDRFVALPEFGVRGKVLLTSNLALHCGYTLLLVQEVARTGGQIDRAVNTSQIGGQPLAGTARPAPGFRDSDIWLQGVNVGLDFQY